MLSEVYISSIRSYDSTCDWEVFFVVLKAAFVKGDELLVDLKGGFCSLGAVEH